MHSNPDTYAMLLIRRGYVQDVSGKRGLRDLTVSTHGNILLAVVLTCKNLDSTFPLRCFEAGLSLVELTTSNRTSLK
jgi:hypothetical protein